VDNRTTSILGTVERRRWMLSNEQNERLTKVGPGTPMGELMRRYWHPVAAAVELEENPTKAVRHLGESLVLYKDRSGLFGLIQESCPHRRVNLLYGIPEQHGLRCPYHGWLFDETGRCLEMPAEAPDSTFKDRVTATAYPVQELSGLIWAYLGPDPVPLLPRWDLLVLDNVMRDIGGQVLACNWLQCMENSLDPIHLEWLHGYQSRYVLERQGISPEFGRPVLRHAKIGFDVFEHGIIKRRTYRGSREEGGTTEEDSEWRVGHPIIFPNWLRVANGFQMRIPMDDTHTWVVYYNFYTPPAGVQAPTQDTIPLYQVPIFGEDGRNLLNFTIAQDTMAWTTQGSVADRTVEKLAESDKGIILYRRLLQEQMRIVEDGGDPMNVIRDPARNEMLNVTTEFSPGGRASTATLSPRTWSPMAGQVDPVTGKAVMGPTGAHSPLACRIDEIFAEAAKVV
jgi:5,5'-dehydrodivanillate O-demethylase